MLDRAPRAFVVMPFDPDFDAIYRDLIRPALEEADYEVRRADEPLDQRNVLMDVVRGIVDADLVVADLTTANANVFYELGIAHGLLKPTLLIAQSGEVRAENDVPFDLRSYRIAFYSTRFDEVHRLKEAITEVARGHRSGDVEFRSPVTDFALPALATGEAPTRLAATPDDDRGLFEHLEDLEKASGDFAEIMDRVTDAIVDIGEDMERQTALMEAAMRSGRGAAAPDVRRMVNTTASDLTRFATRLEVEAPELEHAVDRYTESGLGFLHEVPLVDEDDHTEYRTVRETLASLLHSVKESREQLLMLRDATRELPGLTREINRAKKRAVKNLDALNAQTQRVEAYAEQAVHLADERLAGLSDAFADGE